jgi:hypothetical protein
MFFLIRIIHYEKFISDKFEFELRYLGKENNIIKIRYDEFFENTIRQAFQQDITWDLEESDIVSYKNIKIKIRKATNNQLVYTILEDNNLNFLP